MPLENDAPASRSRWLPLVAILIAATVVVLMAYACTSSAGRTSDQEAEPAATHPENDPDRVTFVAVGDNLPEVAISEQADAAAGEAGDGRYDFRPLFAPIRPYVAQADLAYMNQETHLGGGAIGPQGYPSFNVPDAMADAVVDAGFDFVASASNHSYDWGLYGALDHSGHTELIQRLSNLLRHEQVFPSSILGNVDNLLVRDGLSLKRDIALIQYVIQYVIHSIIKHNTHLNERQPLCPCLKDLCR